MRTILMQVGRFPVPAYAAMLAMGASVLIILTARRAERRGLSGRDVIIVVMLAYVAGLVGARVLFVAEHAGIDAAAGLLAPVAGGFASFGGIVVGGACAVLGCHALRLPWRAVLAAALPGLCWLGVLGRVGCFLAGCCHGVPTDLPWGVTFPPGSAATHAGNAVVHPTQLYEATVLLVLAVIAGRVESIDRPRGTVVWILLAYCGARLTVDGLRGDVMAYCGLSMAQWIALGLGAALLVRRVRVIPPRLALPVSLH
jgi:phosphatidylglycerol---prolipoprotein diacylglyceryl transferase